jgi:hypothetical protein
MKNKRSFAMPKNGNIKYITALIITILLSFLPLVCTILAALLEKALFCKHGMETTVYGCYFQGADKIINFLGPMAWFCFITLPAGVVVSAIILVIWFIHYSKK